MRFKYTLAQIFDLEIPFGAIFELLCEIGSDLCEPTIWAIWCNTVQYSIPIALKSLMTYHILTDPYKDEYFLWMMSEWFSPLAWWHMKLKQILDIERQRGIIPEDHIGNLVSIVIIHRPYFMEQEQLCSRNEAQIWETFEA